MSAKQMGRVFDLDCDPITKLVLLALTDHADHEGSEVWPSVGYLVHKTNLSERTVRNILKRLSDCATLVAVEGERGGRGRSKVYAVYLDTLPNKPKFDCKRYGMSPRQRARAREKGANGAPFGGREKQAERVH